jgi:hypothetical protein
MRMARTATIIIKSLLENGTGLLKCPADLFSVIVE